jgi:Leucine-rich repeat (LRR) protein
MHTLSDLRSGRLAGATQVKIAEALVEFPRELFELVETLEHLDLSGNELASLPDDFARFKKLRRLFLSNNRFRQFPTILSQCPELSMVGFKANQIVEVAENALPQKIHWLILTDNQIEQLPRSIGNNVLLQKVMLAGNRLQALPDEMANCVNIELLRIAANQLSVLPAWLPTLPKLSWLAFAGNPCSQGDDVAHGLEEVHWDDLQLSCQLGEGASGVISQARWDDRRDVAMKEFKGSVTSDGLPEDEMKASIAAGQHKNLVTLLAKLIGHPQQKSGLLLDLIDKDFANLAGPPSLDSCTRDIYETDQCFSLQAVLNIVDGIASAAMHLHERDIMHGDLYGHNILLNQAADCLLGDFGAATIYNGLSVEMASALERLEVRAFGCLVEELLHRLEAADRDNYAEVVGQLNDLQQRCMAVVVMQRPSFCQLLQRIEALGDSLD